jgi:hypothetical protein
LSASLVARFILRNEGILPAVRVPLEFAGPSLLFCLCLPVAQASACAQVPTRHITPILSYRRDIVLCSAPLLPSYRLASGRLFAFAVVFQ